MTRRRSAAAAQNTRSLILDTAEQLFASRGVESVSLRQIGIAAGCANHFVVQYHFGDKNQLVTAIYERRLGSLEGRRAKLMAVVRQNSKLNNVRALMEVLLRPLADEVNAQGSCSYAAFLLSSFHLGLTTTLPAPHLAPLTDHVVDLLYAANSHIARDLSRRRLFGAFILFLHALTELDREHAEGSGPPPAESPLIDDAIDQATAAFNVSPSATDMAI